MNRYAYKGAVMEFDRCVDTNYKAETMAPSVAKARSNLTYRWKKENNREPYTRITLPDKIVKVS
jgi:hypothetical protein